VKLLLGRSPPPAAAGRAGSRCSSTGWRLAGRRRATGISAAQGGGSARSAGGTIARLTALRSGAGAPALRLTTWRSGRGCSRSPTRRASAVATRRALGEAVDQYRRGYGATADLYGTSGRPPRTPRRGVSGSRTYAEALFARRIVRAPPPPWCVALRRPGGTYWRDDFDQSGPTSARALDDGGCSELPSRDWQLEAATRRRASLGSPATSENRRTPSRPIALCGATLASAAAQAPRMERFHDHRNGRRREARSLRFTPLTLDQLSDEIAVIIWRAPGASLVATRDPPRRRRRR
jgi:hypothetical protein